MRTYEEILAAQSRRTQSINEAGISGLPPGFQIGCKLSLEDDHTVEIGIGMLNVAGRQVKFPSAYTIVSTDWVVSQVFGGTFYIYVTVGGDIRVDAIDPVWNATYMEEYHEHIDQRYLGKIYTDSVGTYTQVVNSQAVVAGDIDTATLQTVEAIIAVAGDDPAYDDVRVYVDRDGIYLQYYNGTAWTTYLQLGGEETTYTLGTIFPYLQARGVITPGAITNVNALDIGDVIPGGALYRFDNDVEDQDDADPWDTDSNTAFTTSAKWGSHALTDDSADGYLKDDDADSIALDADFTLDWWNYIPSLTGDAESLLKLEVASPTVANGAPQDANAAASGLFGHCIAKLDTNKIVVCYDDLGGAGDGRAKIGTVALDKTISWGAESDAVSADNVDWVKLDVISTTQFVMAWSDNATDDVKCRLGNVSGTTITWATNTYTLTNDGGAVKVKKLDSTHIVVIWYDTADGNKLQATVGVLSGDTITFGSDVEVNGADTQVERVAVLDATHFVVIYNDNGGDGDCHCKVGVVSAGDTITMGAEYTPTTTFSSEGDVCAIDATHFLWVFWDNDDTNNTYSYVGIVANDDEVSWGTKDLVTTDGGTTFGCAIFDIATMFAYVNGGATTDTAVGTLSGTTVTWATGVQANADSDSQYPWSCTLDSTSIATIYVDQDEAADHCEVIVTRRTDTTIEIKATQDTITRNFVSMQESSDDTDTHTITVAGWHHLSLQFDQSADELYFTVDSDAYLYDTSGDTLNTGAMALYVYVPTSGYRIDDLLVDNATFHDETDVSITHYNNGQAWSTDMDFETDLVLVHGTGGKVVVADNLKVLGSATVDVDLTVTGDHAITGDLAVTGTITGNFANADAGYINTSDWTNRHLGSVNLTYDNLAGTFTVGETITEETSANTGIVVSDSGTVLVLSDVTGTGIFTNNREITGGTSEATADVNGATKNQDKNFTHNLGAPLSDLLVKFIVSTDGTDANSFEINSIDQIADYAVDETYGLTFFAVDNNNIKIQTGANGVKYVLDTGSNSKIDAEDWYYKIVAYKLR